MSRVVPILVPPMGAVLRLLAIGSSAVIALGFVLFAVDEMDRGSKTQRQALARETGVAEPTLVEVAPAPEDELLREKQHGSLREVVEDGNDVLLAPFSDVVTSNDNWVIRGVPTLLGLLVFGLGLGLLANFLPKQESHARDWRTT
jgi:hypothetical protein